MISAWDNNEDELQQAQEEVFGEAVRFTPRLARPNKPTIADPTRQSFIIRGVIMTPHKVIKGERFESKHSSSNPVLQVRASVLSDIKQGDHFDRLDIVGRTLEAYEAASIEPNGAGMIEVRLMQLGRG